MRRMMTAALPLLFGAGCLVGPDYERPKVDVPQAWRLSEKAAKAVSNPAWWEQYGDPILNDLVKSALEDNQDLKIATARIEELLRSLNRGHSIGQVAVSPDGNRVAWIQDGRNGGDIVFAPEERWHRALAAGTGMGTRLAITPRPPSLHYYQPDHAGGE